MKGRMLISASITSEAACRGLWLVPSALRPSVRLWLTELRRLWETAGVALLRRSDCHLGGVTSARNRSARVGNTASLRRCVSAVSAR